MYWSDDDSHVQLVQELLEAGIQVDAQDYRKSTALHFVGVSGENPALAKLLLDSRANPNAKDEYGCTPLDCAEDNEYDETAKVISALGGRRASELN